MTLLPKRFPSVCVDVTMLPRASATTIGKIFEFFFNVFGSHLADDEAFAGGLDRRVEQSAPLELAIAF
jgi:hypothetical protein